MFTDDILAAANACTATNYTWHCLNVNFAFICNDVFIDLTSRCLNFPAILMTVFTLPDAFLL